MTYPVNEEHRALLAEANRLLQRLGIPAPTGVMPISDGYLLLVPVLQAIMDRLEALEAGGRRYKPSSPATDEWEP